MPVLRELEAVRDDLARATARAAQVRAAEILARLRELSSVGRTALAVDLLLDCDVQVPREVARELERAADVLLRLTRQPTSKADAVAKPHPRSGSAAHRALVPLTEVLNPPPSRLPRAVPPAAQ